MGVVIYGLVDPLTQQLRYVGKTRGTTRKRLLQHIGDVRRGRVYIPRHKWISEMLSRGEQPEIFEIETVEDSAWREAEQFWIASLRLAGCNLLNATDGGDGLCSFRHTQETRQKQSVAAKRRYQIPGERERTGAAVMCGQDTEAYRLALLARKGLSDLTRAKLSAGAKIHRRTPGARAAVSARMKGRVKSAAERAKLSAGNKGRKRRAESIAKQVQTMTGRRRSDETKARMSVAALNRYHGVSTRDKKIGPR